MFNLEQFSNNGNGIIYHSFEDQLYWRVHPGTKNKMVKDLKKKKIEKFGKISIKMDMRNTIKFLR